MGGPLTHQNLKNLCETVPYTPHRYKAVYQEAPQIEEALDVEGTNTQLPNASEAEEDSEETQEREAVEEEEPRAEPEPVRKGRGRPKKNIGKTPAKKFVKKTVVEEPVEDNVSEVANDSDEATSLVEQDLGTVSVIEKDRENEAEKDKDELDEEKESEHERIEEDSEHCDVEPETASEEMETTQEVEKVLEEQEIEEGELERELTDEVSNLVRKFMKRAAFTKLNFDPTITSLPHRTPEDIDRITGIYTFISEILTVTPKSSAKQIEESLVEYAAYFLHQTDSTRHYHLSFKDGHVSGVLNRMTQAGLVSRAARGRGFHYSLK